MEEKNILLTLCLVNVHKYATHLEVLFLYLSETFALLTFSDLEFTNLWRFVDFYIYFVPGYFIEACK